jgi:hypothetical protein
MTFYLLLLSLLPLAHSFRLAILNDIHLNLTATGATPYFTCDSLLSLCTDLGTYELDPPPALLDTLL